MEKEKLAWRSFADDGSICRQWNSPPTPAFYLLDHRGTIVQKWIGHPGEQVIDMAIDAAIRDVSKNAERR